MNITATSAAGSDPAFEADAGHHHPEGSLAKLAVGAIGIVYGDIGTSPIYAFREALHAASGGQAAVRLEILGVLSLTSGL